MKYCQECGTKIRENAKFCEGCGREILTEEIFKEQIKEKWYNELKEEIRKEMKEERFDKEKKIMDSKNKAKDFGFYAIMSFVMYMVMILCNALLADTYISSGVMVFWNIIMILYYASIILTIVFTILAVYTYLMYKSNENIKK